MYPIAQYEFHENAIPFLTTVGQFTVNGNCFAVAASTKRICVFDSSVDSEIKNSYIKVGQKITCIASCKYRDHEALVIGADNSVQLFDVDKNTQVFNTLIPDGASALCIIDSQIYVGSNCSILGYDFAGEEIFWTVTGDVVSAMCGIVWDGQKCLLAASNDQTIRLFNGEEAIRERKVHSNVSFLVALGPNKYAISFTSGSVSLIDGVQKVWDIAAPGQIVGMQVADYTGGGRKDIAIATAEGSINVIDVTNGNIVRSDDIGIRISGLHLLDFKHDKHMCLAVIGQQGSIRIYMPNSTEGLGAEAKLEFDLKQKQPILIKEKERLLLREFELNRDIANFNNSNKQSSLSGKMPNLKWSLGQRLDLGCAELRLFTEPATPIQASIIESKTTSGGEFTVFEINKPPKPEQQILLNIPDNAVCTMKVDSFVQGYCISFECRHQKFFCFQMVTEAQCDSFCEFKAAGDKFSTFITKSFVVKNNIGTSFKICFQSLETQDPLIVSSDGKTCKVMCDNIDMVVRIINEYCESAGISEFECRSHFPKDIEALLQAIKEGSELDDTKVVQKVEIAGLIASLKDMIVRVENAEAIGQYQTLYESVVECERLNSEIAREHAKRMTNKDSFGFGNQKVNSLVQKFAELRKGNAQNTFLQLVRKELKNRDHNSLSYLLEFGHESK